MQLAKRYLCSILYYLYECMKQGKMLPELHPGSHAYRIT